MTTATMTGEVHRPIGDFASEQPFENRFFEPPQEVAGINAEALLELGRVALEPGVLPPKFESAVAILPEVVRVVPILEREGAEASLPGHVRIIVDEAREAMAKQEVAMAFGYVASFENPKEQFTKEIEALTEDITTAIHSEREARIRRNNPDEGMDELPRGIYGFATKVVHEVRKAYNWLLGRSAVKTETTAYDVGAGLEKAFQTLKDNTAETVARFPMISMAGLALGKLPDKLPLTKDKLAMIAPEILETLFSVSKDKADESLLASVKKNSHELRFLANIAPVQRYVRRHYGYSVDGIRNSAQTLLPAIQNLLPNTGSEVLEIFHKLQKIFAKD